MSKQSDWARYELAPDIFIDVRVQDGKLVVRGPLQQLVIEPRTANSIIISVTDE